MHLSDTTTLLGQSPCSMRAGSEPSMASVTTHNTLATALINGRKGSNRMVLFSNADCQKLGSRTGCAGSPGAAGTCTCIQCAAGAVRNPSRSRHRGIALKIKNANFRILTRVQLYMYCCTQVVLATWCARYIYDVNTTFGLLGRRFIQIREILISPACPELLIFLPVCNFVRTTPSTSSRGRLSPLLALPGAAGVGVHPRALELVVAHVWPHRPAALLPAPSLARAPGCAHCPNARRSGAGEARGGWGNC